LSGHSTVQPDGFGVAALSEKERKALKRPSGDGSIWISAIGDLLSEKFAFGGHIQHLTEVPVRIAKEAKKILQFVGGLLDGICHAIVLVKFVRPTDKGGAVSCFGLFNLQSLEVSDIGS
jgi:hypothetical protein